MRVSEGSRALQGRSRARECHRNSDRMPKTKFSIPEQPRKRLREKSTPPDLPLLAADDAPSKRGKAKKPPSASQLTMLESTPTPQRTQALRLPVFAPVVLGVYKVTDRARDVWDSVVDDSAALYQLQIKHDAKPSICYELYSSFNEFLAGVHEENEDVPSTLSELARQALIRLVITNADDPDSVGTFVRWRTAFYCAGSLDALLNAFHLLDEFFVWKERQMAKEQPFEVQVHLQSDVSIAREGAKYKNYQWNEPTKSLPVKIFECQPCVGKRIITLTLEVQTANVASLVFSGHTYPFRRKLEDSGAPRATFTDNGETSYFHVMKDVDLAEDGAQTKVLRMFSEVFSNLAIRLVVPKEPEKGSPTYELVDALRELPCLHA